MKPHFYRLQSTDLSEQDLHVLWSLAAIIRLCHDRGTRALFRLDELAGAASLAQRQAGHFIQLI
ncbi:MAG: hypothetical protein AB8B51_05130 [Sedimentitalea sp.]